MDSIQPKKRIIILDVLRGFAILGILLMNIQSFAMPSIAYDNPMSAEDFSGMNIVMWVTHALFANGKFMAIFSFLFGASVLLILQNAQKKNLRAGRLHYKRNFWLLMIGLFHAYVIWFGDILVCYALCSFLLYFWRNSSPRKLFVSGICAFVVYALLCSLLYMVLLEVPQSEIAAEREVWSAGWQEQQAEARVWREGTWGEQFALRAYFSMEVQTVLFVYYSLWYALGWMLIGMSAYKSGILLGQRSKQFYLRAAIYGSLCGTTIVLWGIIHKLQQAFAFEYCITLGTLWNLVGTIPLALSYVAMIILWCQSNFITKFRDTLSSVGRMSLTNYFGQSIICSFIFYYLGFFGDLVRFQQLIVVILIWIAQIIFSKLWLQRFTFGPCEYLWRYMTYDIGFPWKIKKE
ncbi:DUF418 domain-containing protein [Candidatus Uabimicrobium amorphum]|uniref:DUF418 domain-containing protein n=1 Tax=Uabimicrobium amorphum TaxID=2596890 RepID=A0A5S9F673_UABAM|nr:DUF418 domain-containing protein [Candidatus Uabimicrobium amorphum]BBM87607.1 hypothetical protein UABAM_06019 [Candidatus Uabimicrobium amorphum]